MEYINIMHIAFYTDKMEEMMDFYTNKIGGKIKSISRYSIYKDRDDRPDMQKIARENPDGIFNCYIELAPNQFIELFPATEGQKEHPGFGEHKGYFHFALLVEDIFETKKKLEDRGMVFNRDISKGPSETYQLWTHDPDDNYFEIMQFTENSLQLKGNV